MKEKEECTTGHARIIPCVRCEHCHKWVELYRRVATVNEVEEFLKPDNIYFEPSSGTEKEKKEAELIKQFISIVLAKGIAKALASQFIIIRRKDERINKDKSK